MTDKDALLRCVIESPQDDLPRLVMADWLEENGEPERAEFIRAQVELSRWNFHPGFWHFFGDDHERFHRKMKCECKGCELRRRERELWDVNDPPHSRPYSRSWSRGFISSITCDWETFRRHAPALLWHPEQEVECPDCEWESDGRPRYMCVGVGCKGTGRIRRPFPPTAQPIERIRISDLTSQVLQMDANSLTLRGTNESGAYRFTRVKCPTCDGSGQVPCGDGIPYMMPCDQCGGRPPNRWTCDSWIGVVFSMPEACPRCGGAGCRRRDGTGCLDAARERDAEARSERAYHYGDVPAGTRPR